MKERNVRLASPPRARVSLKSFPWRESLVALLLGLAPGCCGIASGPSTAEVNRWMSVIKDGDPADEVVAVLKERAFHIEDYRLSQRASPDAIRRMRERGIDVSSPQNHYITADRTTDTCVFTSVQKRVIVRVQLDANDRVTYTTVDEESEGLQWP